ncbi:AI-2E family transporter [Flavobacterium sp.]|uniref:AI-2E family transporter n=1 Tax=Flavobacterium sp. TaxID=239 RepID=UPI002614A45D|nr:AI-2E family transporter [Flavobacterium sp.]MDD3004817.1 AI-2E family transporter [Flavobacterium sp.]
MHSSTLKLPFYVKLSLTLVSLVSIFFILYIAREIIIPLLMALLFAILLRPCCAFLHHKLKFPHVIAAMACVILFVILILGVLTFVSWEIVDFGNDWNKIKENFSIHVSSLQQYVKDNFNISTYDQEKYIKDATDDTVKSGKEILGTTILSFTDTLVNAVLIPIYMFLILLYRTHFMKFLNKLFNNEDQIILVDILCQIKVAVKSYLVGLIIQMVSVATLTSIGFMIAGIKYAILLGVLTGLLNLIPYLGILIAMVVSIFATLTGTPELSMIFGVIIVTIIVQLIDNNILVPLVVSSKVEINAMASIVGIIIGGAIAGISGMFLAIPIIAILKVIFDRIEPLKPWGYLMGDDLPKTYEWRNIRFTNYSYDLNAENVQITTNQSSTEAHQVFTETSTQDLNDEKEI